MGSRGKKRKGVRRTRASACGTKTPYPAKADAERTRENYIAKGTDPNGVRAYQCPYCRQWHVGRIWPRDLRQVQNRAGHWK